MLQLESVLYFINFAAFVQNRSDLIGKFLSYGRLFNLYNTFLIANRIANMCSFFGGFSTRQLFSVRGVSSFDLLR